MDLEGNGNEGVLHIHQSCRSGALQSNGLVSYPLVFLGGGVYCSADMQSVYSTFLADWAE